jgi:hypothetical protein
MEYMGALEILDVADALTNIIGGGKELVHE